MELEDLSQQIDTLWVLISAFLVFLMQGGFAMLEAGSIRSKNVSNVLLKNLTDLCIAAIVWWLIGYAFAFGDSEGGFIGSSLFAGTDFNQIDNSYRDWMFQFAFSATAATIVSGAVAERTSYYAYVIFTTIMTGFIYPVVVKWTWGGGWLSADSDWNYIKDHAYVDFAGSGIVHMLGGTAALVGATLVGKRAGRFDKDIDQKQFRPHNVPLVILGTLILFFGWYGFNAGSTLGLANGAHIIAAKVCMNTTIAAAGGGIITLISEKLITGDEDTLEMANGILAGLVSITAPCANVTSYGAFCIGIIGGVTYVFTYRFIAKIKVDDPLNAVAVHGVSGLWGTLSVGLFDEDLGIFYDGDGNQLVVQLIGICAIIAWTFITCFILFYILKLLQILRIPESVEKHGLDVSHHGGSSYNITEMCTINEDNIV